MATRERSVGNKGAGTRHTPGPWSIYGGKGAMPRIIAIGDGSSVADANAGFPCPEAEQDANARLIAAAPELLEALQSAHDWMATVMKQIECHGRVTVDPSTWPAVLIENAKGAIAKAAADS